MTNIVFFLVEIHWHHRVLDKGCSRVIMSSKLLTVLWDISRKKLTLSLLMWNGYATISEELTLLKFKNLIGYLVTDKACRLHQTIGWLFVKKLELGGFSVVMHTLIHRICWKIIICKLPISFLIFLINFFFQLRDRSDDTISNSCPSSSPRPCVPLQCHRSEIHPWVSVGIVVKTPSPSALVS